uniref:Uncharacterized protein n=1 Tax=Molossus molossus TaxID=27622 RepID=A0A7J8GLP7_MOLMO|nr:hypothetical protein HJG59_011434 [Molossus molossus]
MVSRVLAVSSLLLSLVMVNTLVLSLVFQSLSSPVYVLLEPKLIFQQNKQNQLSPPLRKAYLLKDEVRAPYERPPPSNPKALLCPSRRHTPDPSGFSTDPGPVPEVGLCIGHSLARSARFVVRRPLSSKTRTWCSMRGTCAAALGQARGLSL